MTPVPWTSPTLWAAIVSILASVLQLRGVTIGAEDQAQIAEALAGLVGIIATLVIILRRFLPRSGDPR